jgi:hypothetical protein
MKLKDLTYDELKLLFGAAQDLIDGDFYSWGDIYYQTGLPEERCKEIEEQFRILRNLEL